MIYQNLQDVAYPILRRKCLVLKVYIGNEQRLNKNNMCPSQKVRKRKAKETWEK